MKITYIKIKKSREITQKGRLLFLDLKGIASITFDNAFVVRNIKIFENEKGIFVGMPSIKRKLKKEEEDLIQKEEETIAQMEVLMTQGKLDDNEKEKLSQIKYQNKKRKKRRFPEIAHPINTETRAIIVQTISDYYRQMIQKSENKIEVSLNSDFDYNDFQITSVRIKKKYKSQNRLRGIASITFDNAFAIHNIKIIEGDKGIFIAMPSIPKFIKENENKEDEKNINLKDKIDIKEKKFVNTLDFPKFLDIAHPINSVIRNKIEESIKKHFEEMLNRSQDYIETKDL
ncbi:septation protein SpoVG family protein [Candidatus Phytoplasma oryzae]|nr:septation protein SpoVG family protein [Candidatus Phytoplasma oryzae]